MAGFRNTTMAGLPSSLHIVLFITSVSLFQLGACYPVHSSSSNMELGDTEGEEANGIGNRTPSDPRAVGGSSSSIWSEQNRLAIGLGIGLGAVFIISTVTLIIGYQKGWHRRLFARHSPQMQSSQVPRPIFHVPRYSVPESRRTSPGDTHDPEGRRPLAPDAAAAAAAAADLERGPSCRSITTPPPVYTTFPTFPNPMESYYQPVEIYRAVMMTSPPSFPQSSPLSSPPAMALSSLPLSIMPPPASSPTTTDAPLPPPPRPAAAPAAPAAAPVCPSQQPQAPLPLTTGISSPPPTPTTTTVPNAPRLPSSSTSCSCYTDDNDNDNDDDAHSVTNDNGQYYRRRPTSPTIPPSRLTQAYTNPRPPPPPQPQQSQQSQQPQLPTPPSITYSPTPVPPPIFRIPPFLNLDTSPSLDPHPPLHPHPHPLRSNSHDTNASTIIDQDAMSERSEPVSPTTVPGAALRVQVPRPGPGTRTGTRTGPGPGAGAGAGAGIGAGAEPPRGAVEPGREQGSLGRPSTITTTAATRYSDGVRDERVGRRMPSVVGLGISMPGMTRGSGRCASA